MGTAEKRITSEHFTRLRSEIDQREGGKPGRATSDECAIRLVTLHEASLRKKKHGTLGPSIGALVIIWTRTYRHDPDKDSLLV